MAKSSLKPGDKVMMNNRYPVYREDKGRIFTVKEGPRMILGRECVKIDGYGTYAADGLKKVNP